MNIVNLTPHTINIFNTVQEQVLSVPSSGQARCAVQEKQTGSIGEVLLFETTFGDVDGLPEPQDGTIFIVSLLVRQAMPERKDLYSPGKLLRNEQGQPIGCVGLSR